MLDRYESKNSRLGSLSASGLAPLNVCTLPLDAGDILAGKFERLIKLMYLFAVCLQGICLDV